MCCTACRVHSVCISSPASPLLTTHFDLILVNKCQSPLSDVNLADVKMSSVALVDVYHSSSSSALTLTFLSQDKNLIVKVKYDKKSGQVNNSPSLNRGFAWSVPLLHCHVINCLHHYCHYHEQLHLMTANKNCYFMALEVPH